MNRLLLTLALAMALVGCGPASTPAVDAEATVQAAVNATLAARPTDTPQPTATPAPTDTPEPTETPSKGPALPVAKMPGFGSTWTTDQVVEAFQAAGLECEGVRPMTRDDFGLAPYLTKNATRFLIPSICEDCGGRIFAFESPEDLEKVKAYYVSLGETSAAFFSHTLIRDNILVQINGELPDERAKLYETALLQMPDVTVLPTLPPAETPTPEPTYDDFTEMPEIPTETPTPEPPTATPAPTAKPVPLSTVAPPPAPACCKICGANSKACGNSCISLSKQCHQPPGCACEG